jgi:hypothetical protein
MSLINAARVIASILLSEKLLVFVCPNFAILETRLNLSGHQMKGENVRIIVCPFQDRPFLFRWQVDHIMVNDDLNGSQSCEYDLYVSACAARVVNKQAIIVGH